MTMDLKKWIEKVMAEIITIKADVTDLKSVTIVKTTFNPTVGSNYSNYGGSYYEKYGRVVHVHIGVSGLTTNTVHTIYTLPEGYRPSSSIFGHGTGGTSTNIGYVEVQSSGSIYVRSNGGTYVGADITYLV